MTRFTSPGATEDDGRHELRQGGTAIRTPRWRLYLYACLLVALTTAVGLPFRTATDPTNLVMPYLLAVVLAATRLGRWPAVLVSLLGVLAFDLVFVSPYNTLAVDDAEFAITFLALLAVGLVISTLTARVREQARAAQDRAAHNITLYELSRDLTMIVDPADLTRTVMSHIDRVFHGEATVLFPGSGHLEPAAANPGFVLDDFEQAAASRAHRGGKLAGRDTEVLAGARGIYLPLQSTQGVVGVLGYQPVEGVNHLTADQRRLLEAFASLAAHAFTRMDLSRQARQAQLLRESERLQSALLDSISHDLRTPLASITGALSSLRDDAAFLDDEARALLVSTAWDEARRLDDLVGNLLDMTRIESGARKIRPELGDVQDLVGVALERLGERLRDRALTLEVPDDLPPVLMDLPLMAQALVNLLDNALKYSPPDRPITIRAESAGSELLLAVLDQGPGIPVADVTRIFDKFYRVERVPDVAGTGLGLAISKGIVEAHGGRIWAANQDGGGIALTIALRAAEGMT